MTASTWITGRGELAVGQSLDRGDATEVEVAPRPLVQLVARLLQALRRILGPATLDLDDPVLDVKPRVIDRLAHGAAAGDDVVDRLQDRAREPHRAGAPDDEPRRIAVQHESGRHHARQAIPRMSILGADHVELAEHVVELEAPGEDPEPDPSVEESAAAFPSPSITE